MDKKTLGCMIKTHKVSVPNYQRAYAWNTKQIVSFIKDLKELEKEGDYYYGHFIFEGNDGFHEIIDGQQRLTTLILFLAVCKQYLKEKNEWVDTALNNFETVSYDRDFFKKIIESPSELSLAFKTASQARMLNALKCFLLAFGNKDLHKKELINENEYDIKQDGLLDKNNIARYIEIMQEASVSFGSYNNKSVATQIFELHNTRGVALSTIEIIKAMLMKYEYVNSREKNIEKIQSCFANMYELEETAKTIDFSGFELSDIVWYYLYYSEDWTFSNNKTTDIENFIRRKLAEGVLDPLKLSEDLSKAATIIMKDIIVADKKNNLIGDIIIQDRKRAIPFLLSVFWKTKDVDFASNEFTELLKSWEKLVLLRDLTNIYYKKWYKEDFRRLIDVSRNQGFLACKELIDKIIDGDEWFGSACFNQPPLKGLVAISSSYEHGFLFNNKEMIWQGNFRWPEKNKVKYLIYKYEKSLIGNYEDQLIELRSMLKDGVALEHIFPQNYLGEIDSSLRQEIEKRIDYLGNWFVLTSGQNSSESNNAPKDKYKNIDLPTCNEVKNSWSIDEKLSKKIEERGIKIKDFVIGYFLSGSES